MNSENSTHDPMDNLELIRRAVDGTASPEDFHALQSTVRHDAEARRQYGRYANLHAALGGERLATRPQTAKAVITQPRRSISWLSWRPLTAAAAGIVFGMFCTSMVFGFVVPMARHSTLLDDSFETTTTLTAKVVLETGAWRGDHAEIVGAEQEIKPVSGQRMLRFLRAEFKGKPRAAGAHIADVYRLIDLRQQSRELLDGGAVVQASASVNAVPFAENEKFGCAISLFALDAESLPESASYIGTALENDANAMSRSSRTKLDRDPSSWQRLTTEMRLPANTEFLVLRLHINQLFESDGSSTFTGSYADDVRVVLTPRSPLP
jgi:hypothetical protein